MTELLSVELPCLRLHGGLVRIGWRMFEISAQRSSAADRRTFTRADMSCALHAPWMSPELTDAIGGKQTSTRYPKTRHRASRRRQLRPEPEGPGRPVRNTLRNTEAALEARSVRDDDAITRLQACGKRILGDTAHVNYCKFQRLGLLIAQSGGYSSLRRAGGRRLR